MQHQIPVTIIAGFLGTGKTTFLNRALAKSDGVRFAVIVNDFGRIAIDDELITSHDGETITFANGCICCSLGDSLVATIDRVLESARRPEHFLVESSGVADPRAIADIATLHPDLRRDLIIVLADAANFDARAADQRLKETIETQLSCADLIVLNKCDLVENADGVAGRLSQRSTAPIVHAINADLSMAALSAARLTDTDFDSPMSPSSETDHDPARTFQTVSVQIPTPVSEVALRRALDTAGLLRAKGFLRVTERPGLTHVQRVGSRTSLQTWSTDLKSEPASVLVVIGINGELNTAAITDLGKQPASDPATVLCQV